MADTSTFAERRRFPRYQMAIPVELEKGTGITRDVSAYGVFFETEKAFSVGDTINLTLLFEYVDPGRPVRLTCEGKVVRVADLPRKLGVAVAMS